MSTILHPVGPESPSTYWIRRGVVLAAILLVILIIWAIWPKGSGTLATPAPGQSTVAPPQTGTDTPSASKTPSKSAPMSKSPTPPPTMQTGPSASTPALPACDPALLRVTVSASKSVSAGRSQAFTLSLINGSRVSCAVRVSAAVYELRVAQAGTKVWSTADCASTLGDKSVSLGPEKTYEWRLDWKLTRSAANCQTGQQAVQPGSYVATATYKGSQPAQLTFSVTA